MTGTPVEAARKAASAALAKLAPTDRVALIAFDTQADELFALSPVENGKAARAALGKLAAGGGTDGFPALRMAYEALVQTPSKQRHVLFFTDGQMPWQGMLELVRHMRGCGVTFDAIGLGANVDTELLGKMAALAGGRFTQVDDPANLPAAFEKSARPMVP